MIYSFCDKFYKETSKCIIKTLFLVKYPNCVYFVWIFSPSEIRFFRNAIPNGTVYHIVLTYSPKINIKFRISLSFKLVDQKQQWGEKLWPIANTLTNRPTDRQRQLIILYRTYVYMNKINEFHVIMTYILQLDLLLLLTTQVLPLLMTYSHIWNHFHHQIWHTITN